MKEKGKERGTGMSMMSPIQKIQESLTNKLSMFLKSKSKNLETSLS